MANDLFGAVALVLILGVAAIAFAPAYVAGGERVTVTEEPITVNYDAPSSVNESGIEYDETVTVYNASGDELAAGTDYTWNQSVGNVTWTNTSATTDGEIATITYEYRNADDTHQAIRGVTSGLGTMLVALLFLLAGGYVYTELV